MTIEKTLSGWKELYKAATEFRAIEPWKWVIETDLFGVRNPLSGETGYCCVMGEMGQVLGMAVYLGASGLNAYRMIRDEVITTEDSDFMFMQDCLLVTFENKSDLDKDDKSLIKKLDIQAKGKKAWPMFRKHEPGYFPWYLEPQDVAYMTLVVQQAKEVCLRLKDNGALLLPPVEGRYLVRTYHKESGQWGETWMTPEPLQEKVAQPVKLDELALQKIKKNTRTVRSAWEIDFFYVPAPIQEEERPIYPYSILIADKETGFIHDMYFSERKKAPVVFVERLLLCMEQTGTRPSEIVVKRQEAVDLFQRIADRLGIRLQKTGSVPAVEQARRSMESHLLKKGPSSAVSDDEDDDDEKMEELLLKAGSEISIFGLYGLIYGCLAAPNLVMPLVLMPAIFGRDGANFETESQAEETIGNIMSLWNNINQWDVTTEGILLPDFDYPSTKDGLLQRSVDAIDLASSFISGLELGGLTPDSMPDGLKKDAALLVRVSNILIAEIETIEKSVKSQSKKLTEAHQAIERAEGIIDICITSIYCGLKGARPRLPEQISKQQSPCKVVPLPHRDKVGRNEPCPCGSGKKFKKCCGLLH